MECPALAVVVAQNEDGVDQHHQERQPAERREQVGYREAEWLSPLPPQRDRPAPSLWEQDVGIDDEVVPVLGEYGRVEEDESYQDQPVTRQPASVYHRLDDAYRDGRAEVQDQHLSPDC